jgi:tetratricopeptide (TPR) repeat protein
MWLKSLLLSLILISCQIFCQAQENWPSPELEQMYHHVQGYEQLKNYKDAIITLKQLINLVPAKQNLKTELGNLYYLSGDYQLGKEVLEPLILEKFATDTTYELLAACQTALKEYKQAKKTIKKGMSVCGNSGLLYYREGQLFMLEQDNEAASKSFINGINSSREFPDNYLAASLLILGNKKENLMLSYGLEFGETYLAMRADTSGNDSLKEIIYNAWVLYFNSIAENGNIEEDSLNLYLRLTPVVSDGVTTENLTMVRTRVVMNMMDFFKKKTSEYYTDELATYQLMLIRQGWFDIYNEWLFGKAEHSGQYAVWNKFHDGDMARFEQWRVNHLFKKNNDIHWLYPISIRSSNSKKKKR